MESREHLLSARALIDTHTHRKGADIMRADNRMRKERGSGIRRRGGGGSTRMRRRRKGERREEGKERTVAFATGTRGMVMVARERGGEGGNHLCVRGAAHYNSSPAPSCEGDITTSTVVILAFFLCSEIKIASSIVGWR